MFEDYPILVVKMSNSGSYDFSKGWLDGTTAYIGRGSPLANPYSSKESKYDVTVVNTSEEAIKRFDDDLWGGSLSIEAYRAIKRLRRLNKTSDITLVCFCKPDCCHGDSIRNYLEEYVD